MTLEAMQRSVPRPFWSLHTHSRYSQGDALSKVPVLVERAAALGYPALGLTDHGTPAGCAQLYRECRKAGLEPAPGIELYVTHDSMLDDRKSMHLTVAAYTERGYRSLVALNNTAWRQFRYRPRVDFADLAQMAEDGALEGLVLATGCRSGPVVRALTEIGPAAAQQVVEALAGWFPRTYVEIMNHGFAADGMSDDEITDELFAIAEKTGVRPIVTGDAHYTLAGEQSVHQAFKELVGFTDPEDAGFSGTGYHLLTGNDLEHLPFGVLAEGLESLRELSEALAVRIPEIDTFSLKIPDITLKGEQPEQLERDVMVAHAAYLDRLDKAKPLPRKTIERYDERVAEELRTITDTGMAGYILLIAHICAFMREQGIWYRTRGSASGSLVCFELGITQEDPVVWDIRMDRFLAGDRTSPPDVDLDIEHTRRDEVVTWLRQRYPVLQVGTRMHFGLDAEEDDPDQRGSLRVKYFSTLKKSGVDTKGMTWRDVPPDHRAIVSDLAERQLIASTGAHPGGYVVAADWPTVAALPVVQIGSSGTFVTAYDKDEIGDLGFPKIDLLGSKALTGWRIAADLVAGSRAPITAPSDPFSASGREWLYSIPAGPSDGDKAVMKRIRSGRTGGMFQLEGWSNRAGCEEVKPTKVRDLVAIVALYRPAAMSSGFKDTFVRRRDKTEPVAEQHADIAAETRETYGVALYQEQVIGVLRRIGMDKTALTKMLKAVKASGKAGEAAAKQAVAEALPGILDLARGRGWDDADVDWLAHALTQYGAGYSFNKGHAVAYGVGAYYSAVLATHEPLAFWTGMLIAYTGATKGQGKRKVKMEELYAREAREDGVRVAHAHVNKSGEIYTPDPDSFTIVKGLTSIPGVGPGAARELIDKRPFESVQDLCRKVSSKVTGCADAMFLDAEAFLDWAEAKNDKGEPKTTAHLAALHRAGALKGLPYGTPMRKAKGRIRKCKECKHTFGTPLEYEDHVDAGHPAIETPPPQEDA